MARGFLDDDAPRSDDRARKSDLIDVTVTIHAETEKWGVIARENKTCSHYVMVRFDGRKRADPCHPTALDYSRPDGPTLVDVLSGDGIAKAGDA